MAVSLDAFDEVPGRRVALTKQTSRQWRTLNTVACEGIARLRAQRLLDEDRTVDAVPFIEHANKMMVRNNVARLVRAHGAT